MLFHQEREIVSIRTILKNYLSIFFCTILIFACKAESEKKLDKPTSSNSTSSTEQVAENQTPPTTNINNNELANTFLWKVEKTGQPTSYLLGTIHVGKLNSSLPASVIEALDKSNTLILESNIEPSQAEIMSLTASMIAEEPLSQKIGQERFDLLQKKLEHKFPGGAASGLEMIKPWAVVQLILYSEPEGYSIEFGIDKLLNGKAKQNAKKQDYLETVQEVSNYFINMPDDKINTLFDVALKNEQESTKQTQQLLEQYQNGQLPELAKQYTNKAEMLKHYPVAEHPFWEKWLYQDILIGRTQKWLPKIESQLATEPTLIAVGAAHLVGDQGLIKILRDKGYSVTPVMP